MFEPRSYPTLEEFTDAAFRYTAPDQYYPIWLERSWVVNAIARLGCAMTLRIGQLPSYPPRLGYSRKSDQRIIWREQQAEGFVPGEEDLRTFASNQLIRYKRLH